MTHGRAERRLLAVLVADVVGYSLLVADDDEATLGRLNSHRQHIIDPVVAQHRGRIVKTTGDGFLAAFASAVDAVRAAVDIQAGMAARNSELPASERMDFRIGINVGDVIEQDGDIFGQGVNIAARLETIAEAGGICLSERVREDVAGKLAVRFSDMGEQSLKNIMRPIRVWRLQPESGSTSSPLSLPDKPSIAVLPFHNLSGDPEQEYLADGITEEITTALARLRGFLVIARNSAFSYKGQARNIQQVGRDLGVRYILEGSVRKARERVRIGVQLADAGTGREVWGDRYEGSLSDVFLLEDEIAASVVTAVEPQLYSAESVRLQQKPPSDLDAWDCVIRALPGLWRLTRADNAVALDLLTAALRLDPNYARALGLHAWISLWNAHMGWGSMTEALPYAARRARAAVELDREDPWARLAFGCSHMFARKHDDAVEELQATLNLNPNFALAYSCLGLVLAYGGKGSEGVASLEKAMRLSPRDPFMPQISAARAFAHFVAREYAAGAEWGRRAVRQSPEVSGYWRALALSEAMLGNVEEARVAVENARRLQPDFSIAWVENESPLVHAVDRARYCDALKEAGLPDLR